MTNKNIYISLLLIIMLIFIFSLHSIYTLSHSSKNNAKIPSPTSDENQNTETILSEVELTQRYLFTNDLTNPQTDQLVSNISKHPDWTTKLIRFEPYGKLKELDESALKKLTDMIPLPANITELSVLGSDHLPQEEGIYRAILEISNLSGHHTLEELILIYDTTGARIDDTADKIIFTETENLNNEPLLDFEHYTIIDNVDGKIPPDSILYNLELIDEIEHKWNVHLSYTDRAGNESHATFLVQVKEHPSETPSTSSNDQEPSTDISLTPSADTNHDAIIDEQEAIEHISPTQQHLMDTDFGTIIQFDAQTYALCVPHPDYLIDGKTGSDYLFYYLAQEGLEPTSVSGGWITEDNYCFSANNVHPVISIEDETYWD